jgi:hypothetical protein
MKKWPVNIYLLSLLMMFLFIGCSGSDGRVVTNTTDPPSKVGFLTVTPADGQLTVTWAAVTGATSYEVYYTTTNDISTATKYTGDSNVTDTTCIITGLTNGTPYHVWAKAVNSAGSSDFSTASSPVTPIASVTIPSVPVSLAVTAGDAQLTVTWPAVTGATSYEVYYKTTNDSSTATKFAGDSNSADTTCIITGLTNGTSYYVWARAVNSIGSSDFSSAASPVTPIASVTIPSVPVSLAVTAGDAQLTVTWAAVTGATSYEVYYKTTNDSSTATKFAGDSNLADTTCVITGLTNGTSYYVWAKAVNSIGSSDFSSASSPVTPIAPVTIPSVPVSLAVTAGDAQVTVTWPAVTGATSYKVYYNTANNSSTATEFTGDSNATDTTCIITGLTNGTPYYVWAKAVNSAGSSAFSSASSPSSPSAPAPNTALFNNPIAVTSDGTSLYVADYGNHTIRKIVITTGATTTLAGTAGQNGSTDGTGAAARFKSPQGVVVLGADLYVADSGNNLIRKIVIATGEVTTLAGIADSFSVSMDGTGTTARFAGPLSIATDGTDLYVSDFISHIIRKVTTAGVVTTIAGTKGSTGNTNGTGLAASFNGPTGITTDGTNLFVTDGNNYQIRKIVIATGAVTTLAGSGSSGSADNANGLLASFTQVFGPTHDGTNLYVSDTLNRTIRTIAMATGATTTLAGTAGVSGTTDATGSDARFSAPKGMTRVGGSLFLADFFNHTIRKIVIATGAVTTFAGTAGTSGSTN